ncbi:putative prenylated rab acceptor P [Helianthus annuus]|nr:putative prenylated rab acceptor P [Helianthus annuus]KAJ0558613.1 putative prenylated rab acceptor P [Helianthus annuus]KAJ0564518.1 putative prenylated rab acceptor P [Helianthus annuus]KAJ0729833.1 putative prenylated rab acceptor P [Helianthus annuus]KAJ0732574.1 putative prenylated rab acceptor P [Helianthus annuus]
MSSPPPSLPVTNNQSTTTPSIATPALRSFISRLSSSLRHSFSQRRPWSELVDRSAFSRPETLTDAVSRIRKNFLYFRINYTSLLAVILAFSLLSHPFSLIILLSLLGAWLFLYLFRPSDQPLVIAGRTFSDRETLLILIVFTIIAVFLTEIGSVMISAVLVGLAIVCVHGAFRVPEELFFDDQEQSNGGLLSFLGGAASSTAVAQPVARV